MRKWGVAVLLLAFAIFLGRPVLAFESDPVVQLGEAVAYWQELALKLAAENESLRSENAGLKREKNALEGDVMASEELIEELRSNVEEMAVNVEQMDRLRAEAESALSIALNEIKSLETVVRTLSGPRFGAILGATYVNGETGILAGVTVSLK